jgi:hypothetical protein
MTLLVIIFAVSGLIGSTYFTEETIAQRDWFAIILGVTIVPGSLWGIWRTLRLGFVSTTTASASASVARSIAAKGSYPVHKSSPSNAPPWTPVPA